MDQLLAWTALHWMLAERNRTRLRADDDFYERELWRMPRSRLLLDSYLFAAAARRLKWRDEDSRRRATTL
jgi:hypothetical protein